MVSVDKLMMIVKCSLQKPDQVILILYFIIVSSAVVDTAFVDIYVDTKNIPTCRYDIQHIDKRTMEK